MLKRWAGGKLTWTESPFCDPLEDTSATVATQAIATTSPVVAPAVPAAPAEQSSATAAKRAIATESPVVATAARAAPAEQSSLAAAVRSPETAPIVKDPPIEAANAHDSPETSAGTGSKYAEAAAPPSFTPATRQLDRQLEARAAFAVKSITQTDASALPQVSELNVSNPVGDATDVAPTLGLAWTSGAHTSTTSMSDMPVGAYDHKQHANGGIGRRVLDLGYSYLDQKNGREFSATMGMTYNFDNNTMFRKGIGSQLDWGVTYFLSEKWQVGVAGYANYLLTGDGASAATPGPFKSRAASIGPQVGYAFTIGGLSAYANVRTTWEFWSEDRVQGYAVNATLEIPFGWPKYKADSQ